jgi:uncharacterized membrane protein
MKDLVPGKTPLADRVSRAVGSWTFINVQAILMVFWVAWNTNAPESLRWDPYPFILLNLFMSAEAAFTAPAIMMAQNRTDAQDRSVLHEDVRLDREALEILKRVERKLDA